MSAAHDYELLTTTVSWVAQKLRVSHSPYKHHISTPIARHLLATLGAERPSPLQAGWKVRLEVLLNSHFDRLVLQVFLNDDQALWLFTKTLLSACYKDDFTGDGRKEAYREKVLGEALTKLEGGRQPLREFQAKYAPGSSAGETAPPLMAYLTTCAQNALRDQMRKKGQKLDHVGPQVVAQETRGGEDEAAGFVVPHAHHAEAALMKVGRAQRRVEALRLLLVYAAQKMDAPSKQFLEFYRWKSQDPDDHSRDQNRFADEHGIPSGTVNSNLKRFRDRFCEDFKAKHGKDFTLTSGFTTEGDVS